MEELLLGTRPYILVEINEVTGFDDENTDEGNVDTIVSYGGGVDDEQIAFDLLDWVVETYKKLHPEAYTDE